MCVVVVVGVAFVYGDVMLLHFRQLLLAAHITKNLASSNEDEGLFLVRIIIECIAAYSHTIHLPNAFLQPLARANIIILYFGHLSECP